MSEAPNVRIVRGSPDELEVAALVAGLAATGPDVDEVLDDAVVVRRRWVAGGGSPRPTGDPEAWRFSLRS